MGFGVDMAKAKELHKSNIRGARSLKFPDLDIEFNRAMFNYSYFSTMRNSLSY